VLTLIVPAYNESRRILPTLEQLTRELRALRLDYDVLVVAEGKDDTAQKVDRYARTRDARVRLATSAERLGKGGALALGMSLARGDVVFFDADAAMPAREIPKLLAGLERSDVVVGSRYLPESRASGITPFRLLASRIFNLLARVLFGLPLSDTQCGYKALRAEAVRKLLARPFFSRGWEWDIELLHRARSHGMSLAEVPIEWRHVPGGPLEEGRLAGVFKTGWKMFWGVLRLRLSV
jgi:dolichyl-phosphate beta-glucosyltransferase